ncbi:hypothetical protein KC340_g5004 [Hortaea werneckii]|nr:hypothetical protein KC342_g5271 [Hortaea werneckii]KAI7100956.1 hypothetical protein KC339_g7098 [Hortaea werneckii]KAI7236042.1 hypothetical protein KC365_g5336 [Hortaea werneckii]KAI7328693.1 hypothetical protein KC340_g5004 [Hortaea werneckii]KAI7388871.1 hypothetical protein KC328_g8729 [Hortaea werneckii]
MSASTEPPLPEGYCDANNHAEILGVTGSFFSAALIIVGLRFYVRSRILQYVGADDYLMLVAMFMATATFTCFVGETRNGLGRHFSCLSDEDRSVLAHWQFFHNLSVMFGVVFVKISIAVFLMRLAPKPEWKRYLWGAIVFLVCFMIACAGTLIFSCTPVSASWNHSLQRLPSTRCFSAKTFSSIGLFNSIINILTDFIFAILPIPIVVKLKVNLRTKCTLVFVLSLGFVACAAGIAKARTQTTFMDNPDPYWHDGFMVWNMVELCLGILAASLPALKPLFSSILASSATMLGMSSGGGYRSKSRAHHTGQSWQHPSTSHIIMDPSHPFPSYHLEDYTRGGGPPGYDDPPSFNKSRSAMTIAELGGPPPPRPKSYDVRITSCVVSDARAGGGPEWDDEEPVVGGPRGRSDSEERLHHPIIHRTVEVSRTSEILR